MGIEKKIRRGSFAAILSGEKKYELRLADFACEPGDVLVLREWDHEKNEYTGRTVEKDVTRVSLTKNYRFHTKEEIEEYGFPVIGFR